MTNMPHKAQFERFTLGCMLADPGLAHDIRATLRPDDFFIERNGWIFEAIAALQGRGDGVDIVTVCDELRNRGRLQETGADYVAQVAQEIPTTINWATYVEKVRELAARRRVIAQAAQIVAQAHDENADLERVITNSREMLNAMHWDRPGKPVLKLRSAGEILTTAYPDLVWAIPDLLPVGLAILAGKPKVGKSWLALQIAQAVATGGHALGQHLDAAAVLYLALEDSERRLKHRMQQQGWPLDAMADFMPLGQFVDQVGDLRNGGGERLALQIEEDGYRLVVIDTLSRSCYGDQNDVQQMTRALTPLQEMAHEKNCAVLMVDHHRKGFGSDPDAIGDVLGSTAKGAMADTVWGLYRERGKSGAKLQVTGREIEERNLALAWDMLTGCWQLEGDADELAMTERREEILDMLETLGKAGVVDIAREIGQPKSNTFSRLQDLVGAGLVVKDKVGRRVFYELRKTCYQESSLEEEGSNVNKVVE